MWYPGFEQRAGVIMGIFGRFFGKREAEATSPSSRNVVGADESKSFTSRAVAYLKAEVTGGDDAAIALSREDSPVLRRFADGLLVSYVVDTGKSYEFVQNRHLDLDGIDEQDLHRIGLENLMRLVNTRPTEVKPHRNIFAVLIGGDFEASLLLVDTLWEQQFCQFVHGDYAVAVPARDILSFCDSSSAAGLDELRQLIARVHPSGDHLLSDRLHVRRNGKWDPSY
jgi:Protein of unknown function (DUF1444)